MYPYAIEQSLERCLAAGSDHVSRLRRALQEYDMFIAFKSFFVQIILYCAFWVKKGYTVMR